MQEKHIKYLIVDSINDDLQGMYEINAAVNAHYSSSNIEIIRQRNNALQELVNNNLVKIVWMTNPKFEILNELEKDEALKAITKNENWITFERDCIHGVYSTDLVETIQLENDLYKEIKTLHNRT